MADILDDPVLTMEEEWLRNDQWTDWQGKSYSGAEEWQYVTRQCQARPCAQWVALVSAGAT